MLGSWRQSSLGCCQDYSLPQHPHAQCSQNLLYMGRWVREGSRALILRLAISSCAGWADLLLCARCCPICVESRLGAAALLTLSYRSQPVSYLSLTREAVPDSESMGSSTTLPYFARVDTKWMGYQAKHHIQKRGYRCITT